MPWLKSEGKMPTHEKVWDLSDAAYRLMDAGRHYAVQNMTDGHVPISRISSLTPKPATKLVIHEVVRAKLWHVLPDLCESCVKQRKQHHAAALPKTGYLVHDFLTYNPSRAEYEAEQERKKTLAITGGHARARQMWGTRDSGTAQPDGSAVRLSGTAMHTAQPHGSAAPLSPALSRVHSPVSRTPYPVPDATASVTHGAEDAEPEIPGTAAKAAGGTRGGQKDAAPRHISDALRRATS